MLCIFVNTCKCGVFHCVVFGLDTWHWPCLRSDDDEETVNNNKQMKNIFKLAGAVAVAVALTQSVQATLITGNIGFGGGVTYNTGSAATATQVTSWINPTVNVPPSGSFSSISSGTSVAFTGSAWNFATSTPINSFWSVGGFTFKLLSSWVVAQGGTPGSSGFVVVNGTGIVSKSGFTDTMMSWSFTSQDPKIGSNPDTWTFSASGNSVPDGGATAMLLGIALTGAALLKRKLTA